MSIFKKLFSDPNERELKKLWPVVDRVNEIESGYQKLSDDELKGKTKEFGDRIKKGESEDKLMPEVFAAVKNACRRLVGKEFDVRGSKEKWNMIPFDVQILGAIVLHQGKIAEMKTGEGKTLVATMPLYLNALGGQGAHIVTVNDYLAQRDAEWMKPVYEFLGLSVGVVVHGQNLEEKKQAYAADITYGTNNEYGFDYLRDNMVTDLKQRVQRGNNYAIVDEVDSILIDEARTPLIISAPDAESTKLYARFAQIVPRLSENADYNVDEKMKAVTLTDEGVEKVEKILGIGNLYEEKGIKFVHHLEQALKANVLFKRDKDYVVKEGQVVIVDDFTGRLMLGRRFSEGLHQALEAKEGVVVQQESKTLATITFQNLFRMYGKLAGMTGTAATSAEEFYGVYRLDVNEIPTNQPLVRKNLPDRIYKTELSKFKAVVSEIKRLHEKGQPVLVGSIAIEKSEALGDMLKREGVPHNVLNAKQHEREAQIIANAGQLGAVTIATNMAGRGTDIKLGQGVRELGGLHILGTERHEARRIDNQLRGRSGRQGDPGSSQFYVSMEDELMRVFGGEKMKSIMDKLNIPDDQAIENKLISRSIEQSQSKVEGYNFDIRKHVLEYDDVMNKQREIIYERRKGILKEADKEQKKLKERVLSLVTEELEGIVDTHVAETGKVDVEEIMENMRGILPPPPDLRQRLSDQRNADKIKEYLFDLAQQAYVIKEKQIGDESMRQIERAVLLRSVDSLWMEHLDAMQHLREGIGLRGYGQRDPLVEYKREGFQMFERLLATIRSTVVTTIFKVEAMRQPQASPVEGAQYRGAEEPSGAIRASQASPGAQPSAQSAPQKDPKFKNVGRNDPCPCGSGKKFKKCHGA